MVSLKGEEDKPREYMMSTGMISSLYESTVWEEITGEESVSTISILAKASEEDIDILLISGANLDTEIEKLNTDEATKQEVINAVNSGKIVTIPAENITMGDWHGTGYIVMNPETGAGAYKISGGLNGRAYLNSNKKLPDIDANGNYISYREFDVNNKISGVARDGERFIVGSDGSIYYTDSHYGEGISINNLPDFIKLR